MTYNDRKDIDVYNCSIDVIKLYIYHLAIHLEASKEILLEEYKKIKT